MVLAIPFVNIVFARYLPFKLGDSQANRFGLPPES